MNSIEKEIKTSSNSFYGGVIYIDLRGYTTIVDEKPLSNIAEIIYSYQNEVKSIIKNNFNSNEISSIQFVGDGVMAIIKKYNNDDKYLFSEKIFKVSYKLKNEIYFLIREKKEQYSGLDNLDFGIGISTSDILKKTIFENDSEQRDIYFGNSLNRACKIGDSMSSKKNYIGIDKRIFDEVGGERKYHKDDKDNDFYNLFNMLLVKVDRPFVHLILRDS